MEHKPSEWGHTCCIKSPRLLSHFGIAPFFYSQIKITHSRRFVKWLKSLGWFKIVHSRTLGLEKIYILKNFFGIKSKLPTMAIKFECVFQDVRLVEEPPDATSRRCWDTDPGSNPDSPGGCGWWLLDQPYIFYSPQFYVQITCVAHLFSICKSKLNLNFFSEFLKKLFSGANFNSRVW